MSQIQHRVEIESGVYANTVGPREAVASMYPAWESPTKIHLNEGPKTEGLFNGVLRFTEMDDNLAITGNTVTRLCPVAKDCGTCALGGSGLTTIEMAQRNCARANTAETFRLADTEPQSSFVLLPTGKGSYVVDDESFTDEYNGSELLQRRLKSSPAVVFTEEWLRSNELSELAVAMNGADGSMGIAQTEIDGERIYIPFCSMRPNMGDRAEEDQILRQALNAYFDHRQFDEQKRAEVLSEMMISVVLSASASLANFAHKIEIPTEGSTYDKLLRERYPELVEQAGGNITPRIVLEEQYAGALGRGNIYPEFEAQLGVQSNPYSPTACPEDGQTCHVDYRTETEYAIRKQLNQMGISDDQIIYVDSLALDPSSPDNNMASNRREQNNGVTVDQTTRTLNGVVVRL